MKFSRVRTWLQTKTLREQLVLLSGLVAVCLYLFWAMVLQPLQQSLRLSEQRVIAAEQSVLTVTALADELIRMRSVSNDNPAAGSLPQLLDESAGMAGLQVSALEPSSDGRSVSVQLDAVAMPAVLEWLTTLESTHGVAIDSLIVTPAATGLVAVSLRARSR
tara:strand:+ start:50715 stop:51200 length:486 start_codon:yes stop_codon:yes gene_type:complete